VIKREKEMEKHETFIKSSIHKINPELISEIVGSYRRGAKDSGDIDVLITHPNREIEDEELKNIVKYMEKEKYCVDTFALGNKKYLGVCKIKYGRHFRRLDLLITKKHEFPFAILYFSRFYPNFCSDSCKFHQGNPEGFRHIL
jgi:DNA polymerase/3'-5' exonuclease PolX